MGIKDNFYIKEIDYNTAQSVVIKCHYAHRKAPCTHAFGLYQKSPLKLVGVIIYGSPVSHNLCENLCGYDERYNIYELTRLYVDDGLPNNIESFFVSNTIKLLDKEIIVSYADTAFNHIGVVYQATNFFYTGLSNEKSNSFYYEQIDEHGNRLHGKAIFMRYGNVEGINEAINSGKNIYKVPRTAKHRYVYFNCNKRRKKELLKKLKYPILPYPKSDKPCPITSTQNIVEHKKKSLF